MSEREILDKVEMIKEKLLSPIKQRHSSKEKIQKSLKPTHPPELYFAS